MKLLKLLQTRILVASSGVLLAATGVLALVANADTASPWKTAGESIRTFRSQIETVATVDGQAITRREVLTVQAQIALSNAISPNKVATAGSDALGRLVNIVAVSEEAYRRGFRPGDSEVDAYFAQMRAQSRRVPQGEAELNDLLSGLGMSADEFFAQPDIREGGRRAMAIMRLRESVLDNLDLALADPSTRNQAWSAFEQSILGRASIRIIDPALR